MYSFLGVRTEPLYGDYVFVFSGFSDRWMTTAATSPGWKVLIVIIYSIVLSSSCLPSCKELWIIPKDPFASVKTNPVSLVVAMETLSFWNPAARSLFLYLFYVLFHAVNPFPWLLSCSLRRDPRT